MAQGTDGVHQRENIRSYGGFTTGEPYFRHTLRDEERRKVRDFWSREKVRVWREGHAFFRHAVCTAEVTALRDTDSQVVMLAGEIVCKEAGEGFGSL